MKQDNNKIKILISGGGTGGHIFPALSIANAMRRRLPDCEILFVGALGRMEMERVPAAGYRIEGLPVAGFDRKRLWRNFGVLLKLWKSMRKARRIVADFAPDAAVGVGGYASGPVLKEAQKRGIPTLIQEQNSYAGVTNKLLAPHATAICTAYEGMERFFPADRITLTGNPVRKELTQCSLTQAEAKSSLGARTVNDAVAAMLPRFRQRNTQLLWQTGRLYEQECMAKASGYADVKASAFIADMATAYRAADLVVARAGAGTISELQLLGKAAILIPSPNVAEDHQRRNAEALSDRGAALMLLDSDAVERLGNMALTLVNDKAKLAKLAEAAGSMAMNGSDDKIADILISLIHTDK